jgi:hypothetical protein
LFEKDLYNSAFEDGTMNFYKPGCYEAFAALRPTTGGSYLRTATILCGMKSTSRLFTFSQFIYYY